MYIYFKKAQNVKNQDWFDGRGRFLFLYRKNNQVWYTYALSVLFTKSHIVAWLLSFDNIFYNYTNIVYI